MAPYAIAHLKIGLKLYETGYRFGSDERARIYLTNALEPAQDFSGTFDFAIPALAHEAHAVNEIKRNQRFTVVIGNPPYAVNSANKNSPADAHLAEYKRELVGERNLKPLNDDYVKFIRFCHMALGQTGRGLLGMITNHSYTTARLFRSMRRSLLQDFNSVRFWTFAATRTEIRKWLAIRTCSISSRELGFRYSPERNLIRQQRFSRTTTS